MIFTWQRNTSLYSTHDSERMFVEYTQHFVVHIFINAFVYTSINVINKLSVERATARVVMRYTGSLTAAWQSVQKQSSSYAKIIKDNIQPPTAISVRTWMLSNNIRARQDVKYKLGVITRDQCLNAIILVPIVLPGSLRDCVKTTFKLFTCVDCSVNIAESRSSQ